MVTFKVMNKAQLSLFFTLFTCAGAVASTSTKDAQNVLINTGVKKVFLKPAMVPKTFVPASKSLEKEPSLSPYKVSKPTAVAFGMLLASTAGLMNGACLSGLISGAKQATTAVTGALTNSGTGLPSGNTAQFVGATKSLLSYMGGSAIAGVLVPRPVAFEVRNPVNMAAAFLCAASLLVASAIKATDGTNIYLWLSLAASGIQNSITSTFTANLCRTAHFSGTTSDIGTLIGQLLRGNMEGLPKLKVLCLLFASFWAGSFISIPIGNALSYQTYLVAAGIYLTMASSVLVGSVMANKQKIA